MAQIHKKQTMAVPAPKIKTPSSDSAGVPKKKASIAKLALQFFVVLMSAALLATTLLGIIMALMYGGDRRMTMLAIIAGTLFPVSVMLL
jgi:hypothetical protein